MWRPRRRRVRGASSAIMARSVSRRAVFYVQESIAERFIAKFVEVARSLKLGVGREPGTDVGPLANLRRLEAAERFVADAVAKGAQLRCGGKRPEGFAKGFYFEPAVLTGVTPAMEIMRDEPFCPIAPIATFRDLEDGLAKANDTVFGLAGYVFTKDTPHGVPCVRGH